MLKNMLIICIIISICINLTSYHTPEINATAASQCMSLIISLHVQCVSVWMRGVVSSDTHSQTHVIRCVFTICVSIYEDMDTWTSSPDLLGESLHQLCAVSFEKNYHQIHTETKTKTERPLRQTAKIKAWFNFCIDYIYYIFDFCNIFWPLILLLYTKMQLS